MTAETHRGEEHICSNPASWHPTLHSHDRHHHPPLSWRRDILAADPDADQSWWAVIDLCTLDHSEYHSLLDSHVRASGVPPYSLTRTYGRFVKALVAEAWANRPPGRPPYTIL